MESSSFILGASPWGLHDYVVKGNAFDFAFIDGDHSFMPVLRDIITCAAIVSPGAIIAGHDFQMPSVKLAVKLIAESGLLGMLDTPVDTIWRFVVKAPVPIESSVDKDFVKVFRRLNTDSVGARINQLLDKYLEKMGSA